MLAGSARGGIFYEDLGKLTPTGGLTLDPEVVSFLLIAKEPSEMLGLEPAPLSTLSSNLWGDNPITDTLEFYSLFGEKSPNGIVASMDELRIGDTYASVLLPSQVVPEPSSLWLAGICCAAIVPLVLRCRRG